MPRRRAVLAVVAAATFLAAAALSLMEFDASRLGQAALARAGALTGGTLSARAFRLRPLSGLVLEGVEATASFTGGQAVASIESLVLDHRPLRLLRGEVAVDRIVLVRPHIRLGEGDAAGPPAPADRGREREGGRFRWRDGRRAPHRPRRVHAARDRRTSRLDGVGMDGGGHAPRRRDRLPRRPLRSGRADGGGVAARARPRPVGIGRGRRQGPGQGEARPRHPETDPGRPAHVAGSRRPPRIAVVRRRRLAAGDGGAGHRHRPHRRRRALDGRPGAPDRAGRLLDGDDLPLGRLRRHRPVARRTSARPGPGRSRRVGGAPVGGGPRERAGERGRPRPRGGNAAGHLEGSPPRRHRARQRGHEHATASRAARAGPNPRPRRRRPSLRARCRPGRSRLEGFRADGAGRDAAPHVAARNGDARQHVAPP